MDILYSQILIIITICVLIILSHAGGFAKSGERIEALFAHLCMGTAIWASGFAGMAMTSDVFTAMILRVIAEIGMHVVMVSALLFTQIITRNEYDNENQRAFVTYLVSSTIASFVLTIFPQTVTFVQTPHGMLFRNEHWVGRYIQVVILIAYYSYWYLFTIRALRKSKLKRERNVAKYLLISGILIAIGGTIDIFVPLFFGPVFPTSLITAYFSVLLIFRSRRVYGAKFQPGESISDIIFKNADVPFIVLNSDFKIYKINNTAIKLLGVEKINVLDEVFFEFAAPKRDEVLEDLFANISNKISKFETEMTCRYSGIEVVAESDVLYDRYGQVMNILLILRDCSMQKHYEQTIEEGRREIEVANRAKETFMNKITSGLKMPLETILEVTNSMESDIPDITKPRLRQIREETVSLLGTMNDIIDIATMESKSFEIENIKYDIKELLESVVSECAQKINEEQVTLISHINSSMPRELIGDPKRIRQVLYNLLDNAAKYTETGYIILHVEYRVHYRKVMLNFLVSDTGIGIKKDQLETIFGVPDGDSEVYGSSVGTGLGLSLCRNIIKLMGGEISVKSAFGRGTSFAFSIEQKIDSEKSVVPYMEYHESALIIETNQISADAQEKTLKEMGISYEVAIVPDLMSVDKIPSEGYFSVIFVASSILRRHRQLINNTFPDCHIISINNYHAYQMLENKRDAICAPLFFAQISDVLKNKEEMTNG